MAAAVQRRLDSFLLACLLLLPPVDVAGGQAVRQDTARTEQANRSGTWAAKTSTGATLIGTWTAVSDSASGTVTGTWTLGNPQGSPAATGAWSAAKASAQWTGAWRAVVAGRDGEFSGTWTAAVDLEADAAFGDLFEKAVQAIVSGNWRAGNWSGPWSIRTAKEGGP